MVKKVCIVRYEFKNQGKWVKSKIVCESKTELTKMLERLNQPLVVTRKLTIHVYKLVGKYE